MGFVCGSPRLAIEGVYQHSMTPKSTLPKGGLYKGLYRGLQGV